MTVKINKPQLITLLGHDYVIWKDEEGNLNALDNNCPHGKVITEGNISSQAIQSVLPLQVIDSLVWTYGFLATYLV